MMPTNYINFMIYLCFCYFIGFSVEAQKQKRGFEPRTRV